MISTLLIKENANKKTKLIKRRKLNELKKTNNKEIEKKSLILTRKLFIVNLL